MTRSLNGWPRDAALLVARVVLAVVVLAHTWQKLTQGVAGTAVVFTKFGIPLAIAAAAFTIVVEIVSCTAFVLGLRITVPGAFLVFVMAGAIWFVHGRNGIFVTDKGWELVGVIIVGALGLMAAGPGRFSLDHVFARMRARREAHTMIIRQAVPV